MCFAPPGQCKTLDVREPNIELGISLEHATGECYQQLISELIRSQYANDFNATLFTSREQGAERQGHFTFAYK